MARFIGTSTRTVTTKLTNQQGRGNAEQPARLATR